MFRNIVERQPGEGNWKAEGKLWGRDFRSGQMGSGKVTPEISLSDLTNMR